MQLETAKVSRHLTDRKQRIKICLHRMRINWVLYLFLAPCVTYIFIFDYLPMYGIQIAFRDFKASLGIWGSNWVGFKHFIRFFESYQFGALMYNTVALSLYQLAASFPMPIILALIINYTTMRRFKRFAQTVTYAPHLISTVVMVGMLVAFSSINGLFNQLLSQLGLEKILFLGRADLFRSMYVWSGIWQSTGYGCILYLAALTSVNPELHEAAIVDGASKLQRIWHIDLMSLLPTAIILFIMNMGSILNVGFEKVYLMQNDLNLNVSETIATYVYKIGITKSQFSYSTAIGLFNNIINFILLITVNRAARIVTGTSLW